MGRVCKNRKYSLFKLTRCGVGTCTQEHSAVTATQSLLVQEVGWGREDQRAWRGLGWGWLCAIKHQDVRSLRTMQNKGMKGKEFPNMSHFSQVGAVQPSGPHHGHFLNRSTGADPLSPQGRASTSFLWLQSFDREGIFK